MFGVQRTHRQQVVVQLRLTGECGFLLFQVGAGEGGLVAPAHHHQVTDKLDHGGGDGLAIDHQQLEVSFLHQFIHGHIALRIRCLGHRPSIGLGEFDVVPRQPVNAAQQATGGGHVIALWISFQVGEETFLGIAQGGLIHMLEARHTIFVEGFGLGLVQ